MISYQDVIIFILSKAYQRVYGIFKSRLQPYGLTPMQGLVLHALYEEEGLSAGELGKRLSLDSATLSGVMDRMAESGWILKNVKDDRRVLNIRLTDKALSFRDKIINDTEELNQEILSMFSMEERLLLIRMLKDLRK
ncbi:MAG TPA: MarR family transcriptional regulator [Smithellaceae bacterium]|jgi:DNA-binding MarR family transcriptional regulator|nr:MarR family transcriptional regulator [Syntrophaceae bacterium]NMC90095.1 MarR family transcriptional regulator [Smithella sp.]HNV57485.1 MarR family transcriptional regulator [Smithellaceae bacterium]MBP8666806.1 MarR family transcriptional regulator [Syntrophaceae bacterium]MBP9532613.1 MarR family transcriptional regulator [Syntrophaceae bacterium]